MFWHLLWTRQKKISRQTTSSQLLLLRQEKKTGIAKDFTCHFFPIKLELSKKAIFWCSPKIGSQFLFTILLFILSKNVGKTKKSRQKQSSFNFPATYFFSYLFHASLYTRRLVKVRQCCSSWLKILLKVLCQNREIRVQIIRFGCFFCCTFTE